MSAVQRRATKSECSSVVGAHMWENTTNESLSSGYHLTKHSDERSPKKGDKVGTFN